MLIKEQFFKRLRLNTFFTNAVNSLREVNFHKRVISQKTEKKFSTINYLIKKHL